MDIDIILDVVPDTVALQYETYEAMMQAIQASQQSVPLEVMIELMPGIPNKRELLEKISGGDDPQKQQAMQKQQAEQERAMEMQLADFQVELDKKRADAEKSRASADKDKAEAEAQMIENESARLGISNLLERMNG